MVVSLLRSFELTNITKFFHARKQAYHTRPRLIDNVVYTPYRYDDDLPPLSSPTALHPKRRLTEPRVERLVDIDEPPEEQVHEEEEPIEGRETKKRKKKSKFLISSDTMADVFVFGYGVVVLWGMTEPQEKRFLSSVYVSRRYIIANSQTRILLENASKWTDCTTMT